MSGRVASTVRARPAETGTVSAGVLTGAVISLTGASLSSEQAGAIVILVSALPILITRIVAFYRGL